MQDNFDQQKLFILQVAEKGFKTKGQLFLIKVAFVNGEKINYPSFLFYLRLRKRCLKQKVANLYEKEILNAPR